MNDPKKRGSLRTSLFQTNKVFHAIPTIQPTVIHGSKMRNHLYLIHVRKGSKLNDTLGLALHKRVPCTRAQFTLSHFDVSGNQTNKGPLYEVRTFKRSERVKLCKDILIFLWGLVKSRITMIFYFIFKGLSHLIPTM